MGASPGVYGVQILLSNTTGLWVLHKAKRRAYLPVPEGRVTIAQGFSLGLSEPRGLVPKGRLKCGESTVPSGLDASGTCTQG